MEKQEVGILYLVATPIGNLEDISYRAVKTLKEADLILAEDTRHSKKLLNHLDIHKSLIAYHEHNQYEKGKEVLEWLEEGKNIALITDAGTPGISDPGSHLVLLCQERQLPYTIIPGPVAFVNALILSGQNTNRIVFEGFLPMKKKDRQERLEGLYQDRRTLIFYEAPHKLKGTLKDLLKVFGPDRSISLVRELTKVYEEVKKMSIEEAITYYNTTEPKGEFVLVLAGMDEESYQEEQEKAFEDVTFEEQMEAYMLSGLSKKEAIKQIAQDRNLPKREVYQYFVNKKEKNSEL